MQPPCSRARDGDCSPSATEGRFSERMSGLIRLQREADRCAEEWARTREPGAEGRASLVAIETLRTLALATMADLGARAEPVPAEELARLALALNRIESADRLRIERERAMAEAAPHAEPAAAPWAGLPWDEKVDAIRRSVWDHFIPQCTDPPPPESGCAAASSEASHVTAPDATPDPPAADEAPDVRDAREASDVRDAREASDVRDARGARDADLRRREAGGEIWPPDPPFCPRNGAGQGEATLLRPHDPACVVTLLEVRATLYASRARPFGRARPCLRNPICPT